MLSLNKIQLTLAKGSTLEKKIFEDLNLNIAKGEWVAIIGNNGSGKSTLLNVLSGNIQPDSGEIYVDKKKLSSLTPLYRTKFISKVEQDPKTGTMENMTIFENLAFALKRGQQRGLRPFFNKDRMKLFREKLVPLQMGLENRLDEPVSNLSGGQRQAISLIMALLQEAKILLLDEITAALDPNSSQAIMELTRKIVREQQCTCLMITHNMTDAIHYADKIVLLKHGRFICVYEQSMKAQLTPIDLITQIEKGAF